MASPYLRTPGKGGSGVAEIPVDTIADRDAADFRSKLEDLQIVRVANAVGGDARVIAVNGATWARYQYVKDTDTFTLLGSAADGVYVPEVPDTATSTEDIPGHPAGSSAGNIKGDPVSNNRIQDSKVFPRVPYTYQEPTANINNVSATIEVGTIFDVALVASFTQRDGGAVNRVRIQINGVDAQDTSTPALDYTYTDENVALGDGETREYRSIIHHDAGTVKQDSYGDDQLPIPASVLAGSKTSVTRTLTPRRKIFFGSSNAAPADSAAVRALGSEQWDNDLTFTIPVADGATSIEFAVPDYLTLHEAIFNGVLPLDQTTEILATELPVDVEGGSANPIYILRYRVFRLAPASPWTASSYSITLKAAV